MVQAIDSRDYPTAAAVPLLLALGLAPLVSGFQEVLPALSLAMLVWISLLLRLALPARVPMRAFKAGWIALALPLLAGVSCFSSANLGASISQSLLVATYAVALWLTADLVWNGRAGWVLGGILFGALLAGGLALREYLEHWKMGEASWRTFGQFTNPNFLAGYLVPTLLLTFGLALRRPESFKPSSWLLVLGLTTATLGSALIVTGSRGGLYSLAAGGVVFLVLTLVRRRSLDREAVLRVAALLGILILVAAGLSTPLQNREGAKSGATLPQELCPEVRKTAAGESNQFRILTWQGSWNMARARTLTGWGAGSYDSAYAPHAIAGYTRQAHNSYLQLLTDGGVPMLLVWLALWGAAAFQLLRRARRLDWYWIPGLAGALAASAAHSLFDSLLFVPAIALLTWALLGIALAPDAPEPAPASVAPERNGRRPRQAASQVRPPRWPLLIGTVGLALVSVQVIGQLLLLQGQTNLGPMTAAEKLPTLRTAALLLPWDIQVARALSRAHASLGLESLDEAIREAHRSLRIAPYRLPTYKWIGTLYRAQNRPDLALATYEQGLRHAPNEAALLYAQAEMQQELGLRKEAIETYRRLVNVEASPVGQVRALSEYIEWRFARAHLALSSLTSGGAEEAFEHRRAAACLLAQRRLLFHGNPSTYLGIEDLDADLERSLRAEEEKLWRRLSQDFEARGEARTAELAREQAEKVDETREHLEQIIKEVREDL